jgi:Fic family protein
MPELPIYPQRGREAPGYALERRAARLRNLPAERIEGGLHRLRVDCAFETLRLTGAAVDKETVSRLAAERRRVGKSLEGDALVLGQLDALDAIEAAARAGEWGDLSAARIREVHRLANPPSEGDFRIGSLEPQFRNARPSAARFVPAKLANLLEWLDAESGRSMFPAERMALWFPRFVEISPFEHGNFRTAHLFASYFARVSGYPHVALRFDEAEAIRSDVERAFLFDTGPLVQRFSDALGRGLDVVERALEEGK